MPVGSYVGSGGVDKKMYRAVVGVRHGELSFSAHIKQKAVGSSLEKPGLTSNLQNAATVRIDIEEAKAIVHRAAESNPRFLVFLVVFLVIEPLKDLAGQNNAAPSDARSASHQEMQD